MDTLAASTPHSAPSSGKTGYCRQLSASRGVDDGASDAPHADRIILASRFPIRDRTSSSHICRAEVATWEMARSWRRVRSIAQQFGWQDVGRDTLPPLLCDLSTAEVDVVLRRIVRSHVSYGGPTAILALDADDRIISSLVHSEPEGILTVPKRMKEQVSRLPGAGSRQIFRLFAMPDDRYDGNAGPLVRRIGVPVLLPASSDTTDAFTRVDQARRFQTGDAFCWRHGDLEQVRSLQSLGTDLLIAELEALRIDERHYLSLTRDPSGQAAAPVAAWTDAEQVRAHHAASMRRAVAWQAVTALEARGLGNLIELFDRLLANEALGNRQIGLRAAAMQSDPESRAPLVFQRHDDKSRFYRDTPTFEDSGCYGDEPDDLHPTAIVANGQRLATELCLTADDELSEWRDRIVTAEEAASMTSRDLLRTIGQAEAKAGSWVTDHLIVAVDEGLGALLLHRPDLKPHFQRRMETRNRIRINTDRSTRAMVSELDRRRHAEAVPFWAEAVDELALYVYEPEDLEVYEDWARACFEGSDDAIPPPPRREAAAI